MAQPITLKVTDVQRRILIHIFTRGWTTRQALADEIGCTLMTVSKAVTALIESGEVIADGTLYSPAGRRKQVLKLNSAHKMCVCVDIGFGGVKLGLVGLDGKLITGRRLPPYENPVTQGIPFDAMLRAISEIIAFAGRDKLLGIAVGISGMVNYERGRVLFCPNIKGYDDRPLADELSDIFDMPVLIDTSARCMALGEYHFGVGRGVDDQMFLSLGMGSIASGILVGGKPYRGGDGFAGEIGHTCVRPELKRARCSCGGYDCLELHATLSTVCRNISAALEGYSGYSPAKRLLGGHTVLPDRLREAVSVGDPVVDEYLSEALGDIASVLTGAVNLITPSLVVLGGSLIWQLDGAAGEIEKRVRTACLMPLRTLISFRTSELGEDVALMGAAVMLIERYLGAV